MKYKNTAEVINKEWALISDFEITPYEFTYIDSNFYLDAALKKANLNDYYSGLLAKYRGLKFLNEKKAEDYNAGDVYRNYLSPLDYSGNFSSLRKDDIVNFFNNVPDKVARTEKWQNFYKNFLTLACSNHKYIVREEFIADYTEASVAIRKEYDNYVKANSKILEGINLSSFQGLNAAVTEQKKVIESAKEVQNKAILKLKEKEKEINLSRNEIKDLTDKLESQKIDLENKKAEALNNLPVWNEKEPASIERYEDLIKYEEAKIADTNAILAKIGAEELWNNIEFYIKDNNRGEEAKKRFTELNKNIKIKNDDIETAKKKKDALIDLSNIRFKIRDDLNDANKCIRRAETLQKVEDKINKIFSSRNFSEADLSAKAGDHYKSRIFQIRSAIASAAGIPTERGGTIDNDKLIELLGFDPKGHSLKEILDNVRYEKKSALGSISTNIDSANEKLNKLPQDVLEINGLSPLKYDEDHKKLAKIIDENFDKLLKLNSGSIDTEFYAENAKIKQFEKDIKAFEKEKDDLAPLCGFYGDENRIKDINREKINNLFNEAGFQNISSKAYDDLCSGMAKDTFLNKHYGSFKKDIKDREDEIIRLKELIKDRKEYDLRKQQHVDNNKKLSDKITADFEEKANELKVTANELKAREDSLESEYTKLKKEEDALKINPTVSEAENKLSVFNKVLSLKRDLQETEFHRFRVNKDNEVDFPTNEAAFLYMQKSIRKGTHINSKEYNQMIDALHIVSEWNDLNLQDKLKAYKNAPKDQAEALELLHEKTTAYLAAKNAQNRSNPSALRRSRLGYAEAIKTFAETQLCNCKKDLDYFKNKNIAKDAKPADEIKNEEVNAGEMSNSK